MTATYAEARESICADALAIYSLVADLTQMAKWSPEASGGKWIRGASGPSLGAVFQGTNRSGWRRWTTTSVITAADPGKRFAFHVSYLGVPIADWAYEFTAGRETTTVVETWTDCRPGWMTTMSKPVMGIADRAVHNQRTMALTLTALKHAAEPAI